MITLKQKQGTCDSLWPSSHVDICNGFCTQLSVVSIFCSLFCRVRAHHFLVKQHTYTQHLHHSFARNQHISNFKDTSFRNPHLLIVCNYSSGCLSASSLNSACKLNTCMNWTHSRKWTLWKAALSCKLWNFFLWTKQNTAAFANNYSNTPYIHDKLPKAWICLETNNIFAASRSYCVDFMG